MGNILTRNLGLKLISLFTAILLWGYVAVSENPPENRDLQAPVSLIHMPRDLTVLSKSPDTVKVTVHGLRRIIRQIRPSDVVMVGDMNNLEVGEHTVRLVAQGLRPGAEITSVATHEVRVTLDKLVEETRPVTVRIKGYPAQGYAVAPAQMQPTEVKVRGAASAVVGVASATAEVDISGMTSGVAVNVPLQPVNSQGVEQSGLTLDPPQASIVVPITKVPSKTLPIEPSVGPPAAGYHVVSIRPNPSSVTVTGDRDVLAGVTLIPSDKIDISSLHDTKTFSATLEFPAGLKPLGAASVSVTVTVASGPVAGTSGQTTGGKQPGGTGPPGPGITPSGPETGGPPSEQPPAGEPGPGGTAPPRGKGTGGRPGG